MMKEMSCPVTLNLDMDQFQGLGRLVCSQINGIYISKDQIGFFPKESINFKVVLSVKSLEKQLKQPELNTFIQNYLGFRVFYTVEGCSVYFFRLQHCLNEILYNTAFCSESLLTKQPSYNLTSSISLRQQQNGTLSEFEHLIHLVICFTLN